MNTDFYNNVISYDEILNLILLAQNGDVASKNKLVTVNLGLVNKIVSKFSFSGFDRDDIFQLGCIGLLKAIDRFNPSLGYMFSSYAVPMIEGEIKRFLRDDGIIKISRDLKEINWKVKKYKDFYFKKTGFEPSLDEISNILNIEKDKIKSSLEATASVEFFNKSSQNFDTEYNKLASENTFSKNSNFLPTDSIEVNEIVENLPPLESEVLKLRYFDDLTQKKVGNILGISQVQVSRVEKKALSLFKKEYFN
ncbi:sigma-70 family RNA polymerase sigma factor [Peptacetobacter sp.]|uniref:sigma-70 family RNA polymerase sigma factor n=1 Tax=Peptacetobacter sp. TaxID=2991975 RepID=UPI00260BDC70|nr:sigma-70 family RNA polymerase sigma factor [Peptacetobacter sp.]